ncbi:hypothetical protein DL770_007624 [Monosporascus sp. CRB-9-2]|nr:hypothetical protein DL770_007624 [Monosporascus sp. CRB-9-2]
MASERSQRSQSRRCDEEDERNPQEDGSLRDGATTPPGVETPDYHPRLPTTADPPSPLTPNATSTIEDQAIKSRGAGKHAICIDQGNTEERNRQVQSMAKIYAKASRVVVWLEEATAAGGQVYGKAGTDSDRALEELRIAADGQPRKSLDGETNQQTILLLLQRSWFQRIWVLQEVAAARHILIMCRSAEIDGYAFCSGLNASKLAFQDLDIQSRIRSATYLIKGAIFRPKYATSPSDRFSLNIRPLGELMDMYHNRKANDRRDKVYALLGMSSDDYIPAGLSPDYKILWRDLFHRLVRFLLGKQVSVETWEEKEIAVIKSKGCILGEVSLVKSGGVWNDRQSVDITSKNIPGYLGQKKEWSGRWALHATAKPIRKGDVICLLQGALKPTIIRLYEDYCAVIAIAVTLTDDKRIKGLHINWPNLLRSITIFGCDFLLVWDWEKSWERPGDKEDYECLISSRVPKHAKTELESYLDKAARLRNMGLILGNLEKDEEAEENLRKAINAHDRASGKELSHTLAAMDSLALMCRGRGDLKRANKLGMMTDLLGRRGDYAQTTEKGIIRIAGSFDQEVIKLLLDRREDEAQITEKVVEAAAGNRDSSKELMALLLDQRGTEVKITEEVVKAAAGNGDSGKEMMALFLDQCSNSIIVTPGLVEALAESFDALAMKKLLDQRGTEVKITEEVVKAAAGNRDSGKEMMALFLDQCSNSIIVTPGLVEALAESFDALAMKKLLDQRGTEVKITEDVVKAAAGNGNGKEVMALLLDQRNNSIIVTPGLVKAFADSFDALAMKKLLDQRGTEVKITEEVVKAAAGNRSGKEVMALLLDQRGTEVKITEEVLKAAAANEFAGCEVIKFLHRTVGIKVAAGVIEAAATSGQEQVLRFLDQCNSIGSDKEGWLKISRLYNAAKNGDAAAVRKLVDDGTPPDKQNIRRETPLWIASSYGHKAVVQVLLATDAVDVNVRSMAGQTPLFRAAANGHSEVVKLLLDHGAEQSYTDKDGKSPLSAAQLSHRANVIDILTKHYAQEHRRHGRSSGRE